MNHMSVMESVDQIESILVKIERQAVIAERTLCGGDQDSADTSQIPQSNLLERTREIFDRLTVVLEQMRRVNCALDSRLDDMGSMHSTDDEASDPLPLGSRTKTADKKWVPDSRPKRKRVVPFTVGE